ncbi:MAG: F510_1955 family glycosylhydrolase [Betaproteobacteria bacterium]
MASTSSGKPGRAYLIATVLTVLAVAALWNPASAHVHVRLAGAPASAKDAPGAEPLLQHVHGLAYTPDGGALLVSSHTGFAAFRGDGWAEIDGPIHDFAGFAMTQSAIYASGHPVPGSALPDPLGLVKSADLGRNWTPLALGGQADLHSIAAGYRSGSIYVLTDRPNPLMQVPGLHHSTDEGRTWRRRAAHGLKGRTLGSAVHPVDPGVVAVASDAGLYISRDSGENFALLDGSQAVTAVTFGHGGTTIWYARAVRRELVLASLEKRFRQVIRLPRIGLDYVTHLAQNPVDHRTLAVATDRRHVFVTSDSGKSWRQIAKDGDLP